MIGRKASLNIGYFVLGVRFYNALYLLFLRCLICHLTSEVYSTRTSEYSFVYRDRHCLVGVSEFIVWVGFTSFFGKLTFEGLYLLL